MKRLILSLLSVALVISFLCYQNHVAKRIQGGGEQQTYTFESESIGFSDIQGLYSMDTMIMNTPFFSRSRLEKLNLKFKCIIKKTKIRENTEGVLFSYVLINPNLMIDNGGFPINTELIKQEITHPILAEITTSGQIKNVRIDTAISFMSANFVKNILSQMQFVKPLSDTSFWTIDEENTSGIFNAQYRFDKKEGTQSWFHKTNGGYSKLKSSKNGERILADNQTHILVDSAFRIVRMDISESQVVLFNTDTVSASGNSAHINRAEVSVAPTEELRKWVQLEKSSNYSETVALSAPISDDKMNKMVYSNTLGKDNFESLMEKINPLKGKIEGRKDTLIRKFRALAYLFPDECAKMGAILKKSSAESPFFYILSNALASTETPQAINALAEVIEARQNEEDVISELLPILATTSFPTDKAINIVKSIAFSSNNKMISSMAQLALGGLAGNLRNQDIKKQEVITDFIISKMHGTTDTLQEVLVLGNTGSPKVLGILKGYIYSQASPEIRAAAISSMRFVEQSDAQKLLEILAVDRDSTLRKAAIETLEFRKAQ